jgi:hypothetical protein
MFGRSVVLIANETYDSFLKKIKGKMELPEDKLKELRSAFYDIETKEVGACTVDIADQVIIFKKDIAIDYLVHELIHCVDGICVKLGIECTETRAYMMQYLFNQFHPFIQSMTRPTKEKNKDKKNNK